MYLLFVYLTTLVASAANLKLKPGQAEVERLSQSGRLEYQIDNQFGTVDIDLGETDAIEVRAENFSNGAARVRFGRSGIHVQTERPRSGWSRMGSIALHVRLPSRMLKRLSVRARGLVRVEDLLPASVIPRREVSLTSIADDVLLRQRVLIGTFELKNSQGEVRLTELYPPSVQVEDGALIHLSPQTRTIEAHRTSGNLEIKALGSNGALIERHRGGALFVSSDAGKVMIDGVEAWATIRTRSGPTYARENRGRFVIVSQTGALDVFGHREGTVEFGSETGGVMAVDNIARLILSTRSGGVRVVETAGDVRVWAPHGAPVEVRDQVWGAINVYTDSSDIYLDNPRALREDASSVTGRVQKTACAELLAKP